MSYVDSILRSDEKVVHRTKLHWIIFIQPIFLALIGIVFIIDGYTGIGILSFLPLILAVLDYKSSECAVTTARVILKKGVIRRYSSETYLPKLEGIRIHQDMLGRIFNYGTVSTGAAGSSSHIDVSNVSNPLQVRRSVDEQLQILEKTVH